ncbi:MAG: TonB-dependent receptor plug domain-containing protein, partial [Candidatus Acidiferrales bacterium]
RHEPNFGDMRNTFDVDFLQRVRVHSRQQFSWGLGLRITDAHELQIVSGLTFVPSRQTDQLYSAFFQDEIELIHDRLTLQAGTKLLHTNFTGAGLEPSVRLLWTPTANQTLWAAITHALRTPSDAERDFFLSGFLGLTPTGTPFFARFNANPDFTSEKLNGYELGYRRLVGKKIYVDFSAFYNDYDDLFSEEITGPPFVETTPQPTHLLLPAQFRNGLLGNTTGAEIAPEWKPTSFWRLRGSYSYLHMDLKRHSTSQDVGTAPIIEGSSPQHQVLVQSSLDLPKRFSFDLSYQFISSLPAQKVDSYSKLDSRIGWRFSEQFEFAVVGQNLLQPRHVEFSGEPGPPVAIKRSFYAKITWIR